MTIVRVIEIPGLWELEIKDIIKIWPLVLEIMKWVFVHKDRQCLYSLEVTKLTLGLSYSKVAIKVPQNVCH